LLRRDWPRLLERVLHEIISQGAKLAVGWNSFDCAAGHVVLLGQGAIVETR
jgi:hypothetical protein